METNRVVAALFRFQENYHTNLNMLQEDFWISSAMRYTI